MSAVIPFQFDTRSINVTTDEHGSPWFNAREVCEVLGYANAKQTLDDHVDQEDVSKRYTLTAGGQQQASHINESGLYALILGSKKAEAKRFKRWVTSEVLPTIRKTGGYKLPGTKAEALRALADASEELDTARQRLAQAAPAVALVEHIEACEQAGAGIREAAKLLGFPERQFVEALLRDAFLYRNKSGQLMPYAKWHTSRAKPYFAVTEGVSEYGRHYQQCLVTVAGRAAFAKRYEAELGKPNRVTLKSICERLGLANAPLDIAVSLGLVRSRRPSDGGGIVATDKGCQHSTKLPGGRSWTDTPELRAMLVGADTALTERHNLELEKRRVRSEKQKLLYRERKLRAAEAQNGGAA